MKKFKKWFVGLVCMSVLVLASTIYNIGFLNVFAETNNYLENSGKQCNHKNRNSYSGNPTNEIIVGESEKTSLKIQYSANESNQWSKKITHTGATYIKVHFSKLDLAEGDYITVSNQDNTEVYTYPNISDYTTDGEEGFWSMSITGDTAVVTLHSENSNISKNENLGIIIDKYIRGFTSEFISLSSDFNTESTCGINQRTDVACYKNSHPTEFDKSRAVVRLLKNGRGLCTGWRVGTNNHLFTNEHCVTSQSELNSTEIWFNYQKKNCGGSTLEPVVKVSGKDFLVDDYATDFALFTVNNFDSISHFGYLELDVRSPIKDEEIYIPQHGAGNPKEFGIESDMSPGGICRIDKVTLNGRANGSDTGYSCDTTRGSSGSPVLARSSNKVIALHHYRDLRGGGCWNQGVKIDKIWPFVEPYLGCNPPKSGDWIVNASCSLNGNKVAPKNVIIQPNAVLTIEDNAVLDIDLVNYRLEVKNGGGVLIKKLGKVF